MWAGIIMCALGLVGAGVAVGWYLGAASVARYLRRHYPDLYDRLKDDLEG